MSADKPAGETLIGVLRERVEKFGDKTFLRHRVGDEWKEVSWRSYHDRIMAFASWLITKGVQKGEAVCILSQNRVEWVVTDYAVIAAGGVTAAIYASNLPPDVAYIVNHSEARVVVVENEEQLKKVLEELPNMPKVEHIVIYDLPERIQHDKAVSFAAASRGGETADQAVKKELEKRIREEEPDDIATIIYTSGTTGPPKGAMLTHDNIIFVCRKVAELGIFTPEDSILSYLPLAHALERIVFHMSLKNAGIVCFARSFQTLVEDIQDVQPTLMAGVPRVYEKIYDRIISKVDSSSPLKQFLFKQATEVGESVAKLINSSKPIPWHLKIAFDFFDKLVFEQVRKATGGRIRYLVSGGAPLSPEIISFFHSIGLPIIEAYGLTETSAPATFNRPGNLRYGTVGQAVDEVEIKIADDGEVLVKGRNVFKGYFKEEQATAAAIRDGWFYTGDIGEMLEDGFLKITDRKKDLIITAGGKNIAPQNIENLFKINKYISQMVVIGDRRPYLIALITLSEEELGQYAEEHGIKTGEDLPLSEHPRIKKLVESIIAEKNRELARYESIKKYRVLPEDFTQESGELTPTLKVKRKVVNTKYADLIEEMYAEGGKSG
ncbi:MAG: long-chain fatty acid--CoA ligase [bacterium]